MKFTTASGSVYEANTDSKKIRRLNGVKDPTPRQGKDGEWQPYDNLVVQKGEPAIIFWGKNKAPLEQSKSLIDQGFAVAPTTVTSDVVDIEP